jgi:uncharacterized protein YxeA
MDAWVWIVIAIVVIVVIGLLVWTTMRKRRSQGLQQRFGPEYQRTVETAGGQREAESQLLDRQKRREELDIRPLQAAARERYVASWREIQTRFVDVPAEAVRDADSLVIQVMNERGYPMDDFEQRAADISVDHPHLVENYRSAHSIATRSGRGQAGTEELRQAVVHYRALFEELLETDAGERTSEEPHDTAGESPDGSGRDRIGEVG